MTGTAMFAGRQGLSEIAAVTAAEAVLIDELIDRVLALEPLEFKHTRPDATAEPVAGTPDTGVAVAVPVGGPPPPAAGAKASADSTRAMLVRMREVLDREAARLGADGLEGKAAVDQVALIARTLEKIDQMERLIADDEARAAAQSLSVSDRQALRQTVRRLILAAAERLARDQAGRQVGDQAGDQDGDRGSDFAGKPAGGGEGASDRMHDGAEAERNGGDAGAVEGELDAGDRHSAAGA